MKNKRGFTLIELLAVIVILAIIALIATPIILNMINEARKSAAKSSALGYVDSIEAYTGFRQISEDANIYGYDVDLPTMTNKKVTCTKTSSGWETTNNCKAFFEAVDKKNKGKSPDEAIIVLGEDGKVQDGTSMKYNGYNVTYDGKDATIGGKSSSNNSGNSSSQTTQPQSFADDDWGTIAANTTSNVYKVGDTKCVALTGFTTTNDNGCENGEFKVRIANKTACTNGETSETACGFVVEFVDMIATHKMNLSGHNEGGYPASALYNEYFASNATNPLYVKLPSELQNVIIPTTVVSSHESGVANNYTSTDKLYLFSTKELGFNVDDDSAKNKTRKLDYYLEGTTSEANTLRIKQYNGNNCGRWMRSANNNTNKFYVVTASGNYEYISAIFPGGVAPAFRIGINKN